MALSRIETNFKNEDADFNTQELRDLLEVDQVFLSHLNTVLAGDDQNFKDCGVLQNNPSLTDLNICENIIEKIMAGSYFLKEYDRFSEVEDAAFTVYLFDEAKKAFEKKKEEKSFIDKLSADIMSTINPNLDQYAGFAR